MALYDIVSNRRKVQGVDLQPYGNTISVEAESDNPFEDAQDVEVFTQVNRGMGDVGPHRGARSRAIITQPHKERMVFAGRARATKTVASSHKPHAAFIPGLSGLGADPVLGPPSPTAPGVDWSSVGTAANQIAQTAGGILAQQQSAKLAAAQAAAAQANANAEAARTERLTAQQMMANMGQRPMISGSLLAVAGVAGAIALFLYMRKGGKRK